MAAPVLSVLVREARGLPPCSKRSSASSAGRDTFVSVHWGKYISRSSVVSGSLSPKWGHSFQFSIEDANLAMHDLKVQILDTDNEEFLGQVVVSCEVLQRLYQDLREAGAAGNTKGRLLEQWHSLREWSHGLRVPGELRLSLNMELVDRSILELALDAPQKAAQALLQQLSQQESSSDEAVLQKWLEERPALLVGKCELLDDGLDTGYRNDIAMQLRDWANEYVEVGGEELVFALTATTLQLFRDLERIPCRVIPLEDVRSFEPVDGKPRADGRRSWQAHVVTTYHISDSNGETRSLQLRLGTQEERDALAGAANKARQRLSMASALLRPGLQDAAAAAARLAPAPAVKAGGKSTPVGAGLGVLLVTVCRAGGAGEEEVVARNPAFGAALRLGPMLSRGNARLVLDSPMGAFDVVIPAGALQMRSERRSVGGSGSRGHRAAAGGGLPASTAVVTVVGQCNASPGLEAVVRLCAIPEPRAEQWRKALEWPAFRAAGVRVLCALSVALAMHDVLPFLLILAAYGGVLYAVALAAAEAAQAMSSVAWVVQLVSGELKCSALAEAAAAGAAGAEAGAGAPGSAAAGGEGGAAAAPGSGADQLLARFIAANSDDPGGRTIAEMKYRECLAWRQEKEMDTVFQRPQPVFHLFKRTYPHAFHGRARDGSVVFIEKAGKVSALAAGFAENGLEPEAAAMHLATVTEYFSRFLDPRPLPHGRFIRIVDVEELAALDLAQSSNRALLEAGVKVLSPYFPERAAKIFVVNAPGTFHLAWKLISPLCSKRTLDKISIIGAHERDRMVQELTAVISPEQLPAQYGGTCACRGEGGCFRRHPDECAFWDLVEAHTPPGKRIPLMSPEPSPQRESSGGGANGRYPSAQSTPIERQKSGAAAGVGGTPPVAPGTRGLSRRPNAATPNGGAEGRPGMGTPTDRAGSGGHIRHAPSAPAMTSPASREW